MFTSFSRMKSKLIPVFLIIHLLGHLQAKKLTSVCLKPITRPKILGIYTCECVVENSPEWSEQILIVNCAELELQNLDFPAPTLPEAAVLLDLSYNELSKVPTLDGDILRFLDLSYNQIKTINDYDFVKLKSLIHLNLAGNQVEEIASNGFFGLEELRQLDLSNNGIKQLHQNIFLPMTNLGHLILSGNLQLGPVLSQSLDFYAYFGVNLNLSIFEVERCNLSRLNIARRGALKTLYAARNNISELSDVPFTLETFDFSDNAVEVISEDFFPALPYLKLLLVQDMPNLLRIEALSLQKVNQVNHLSFRGSRKLYFFSSLAFGEPNESLQLQLEVFNLQGTNISTFNSSMFNVVKHVKALDLEGVPIDCDCNVEWIKTLQIETNAMCMSPNKLQGVQVSGVPDGRFVCYFFPNWVYTTFNSFLIILVLLGCTAAVWFVFLKLRKTTERHHGLDRKATKVGVNSPYAPVTTITEQA